METKKEIKGTDRSEKGIHSKDENSSQPAIPKPSSKPFTQYVDGFPIPGMFLLENYLSALSYKPRPDDIILSTYPKCGTTWAQHILVLIFRQGEPMISPMQFFAAAPFLELAGAEGSENMPRPGAIKVHLPYHLTPRSDSAKYIYISRNPKDCCVSYFHHMKDSPIHLFNGTFDEFFEYFISGNIDFGDYFDHLLGWYAHKNDPNVLFMTYEEMKENHEGSVLKMASFVDDKLYAEPLRNDPQKLKNILKYSSFNYMKKTVNEGMEEMFDMSREHLLQSDMPPQLKKMFASVPIPSADSNEPKSVNFVRKGIVGDWRNYFTKEQSRRIDEKFDERTKGTDIPKLFKKYM